MRPRESIENRDGRNDSPNALLCMCVRRLSHVRGRGVRMCMSVRILYTYRHTQRLIHTIDIHTILTHIHIDTPRKHT